MLLLSLTRSAVSFVKPSTGAMICTVASHRLPSAAAARRAAAAPFPALPMPARSFASILTRAQKEPTQPQSESTGQQQQQQQQQQPESGSELQPRASRGDELSTMPFAGDLMDMRAMMPTPFRRMAGHMMQMQREMDSMMGAFGLPSLMTATDPFDIFDRAAAPLVARRSGAPMLGRVVPLDVSSDEQGYTVSAEVPGFDKSEIKVSLSEDGMLTMTGSHEETTAAADSKEAGKEGAAMGGARRFTSFVRSIQLPDDADTGAISATTQHGILTVRIPRTAKPAPKIREIPVA